MYYHIVVVFLPILIKLVLDLLSKRIREKSHLIALTVFFCGLCLLLSLRSREIGTDTLSYMQSFNGIKNTSLYNAIQTYGKSYEISLVLLAKIVSFFGDTRLYIIVTSILIVAPFLYFYSKESKDAVLTIALFANCLLYESMFSLTRQFLALSFTIPAYYCIKRNKYVLFFLFMFLAISCHSSAFIIVLFLPLLKVKILLKHFIYIAFFYLIIVFNIEFFYNHSIAFLESTMYSDYIAYFGKSGQRALSILFSLLTFYCFIVLDEKQADKNDIGLRNILLFSSFLHLFSTVHPSVARLNLYFIMFTPVTLTIVQQKHRKEFGFIINIVSILMTVILLIHFFYYKDDTYNIFNYRLFF